MRTEIVASFQVEALHHWPEAYDKLAEVGFLAGLHRHVFHVRAWREVEHSDRDVEFIALGRLMRETFVALGERTEQGLSMGRQSCEDLAVSLLRAHGLTRCEVLEDGENGAVVTA